MFDIGFLELLLLSVVGLIVLGPERLPRVARAIGAYVGKARRTWTHVRMEIEREIAATEIERQVSEPLESLREEIRKPADELAALRRSTEATFRDGAGGGDAEGAPQRSGAVGASSAATAATERTAGDEAHDPAR